MSDVVERAKADMELWGRTPCVEIEVVTGMTAAEDAYRRAPETVAELVTEVERLRAAIERARALAENLATVDTVWFWHTDYIRDYFLSALKEDQ
ncbi:hypothetical protein PBI_CHE8_53 [Mycobacterium phage Che8]|uniref:Uncharacterized protein n=1 Tax=Mycobacterium virus Che8 TaxID=205868 RepID=Q855F7_9CAUD|nr:hypothetical protein PBI_CHE8_53 [Mycobacterium phage Che8]AAN12451.1 hypothetical protein PBI_CHE8_53 [Mycobacterium phage Che8]